MIKLKECLPELIILLALTILIVSVIVSISYIKHANDVMVSKQPTCYGKVNQRSWDNDATKVLAIQACAGK